MNVYVQHMESILITSTTGFIRSIDFSHTTSTFLFFLMVDLQSIKISEVTYPFVCVLFAPQDGLLSAGYTDFINRIHNQIPQVTSDGKRLQVTLQMFKFV